MDGPALVPGALSTIGLPLDSWDETQGLNEENAVNGAVFFMDPVRTVPQIEQLRLPKQTAFADRFRSCALP